jgi:hypothetical protein
LLTNFGSISMTNVSQLHPAALPLYYTTIVVSKNENNIL